MEWKVIANVKCVTAFVDMGSPVTDEVEPALPLHHEC